MTDSGFIELLLAFAAGAALAGGYLRLLRTAVARLTEGSVPWLNLAGSLVLRLLLAAAVFLSVARLSGAAGLVSALLGFMLMRSLVLGRVRRRRVGGSPA